jgi:hypothetical protein
MNRDDIKYKLRESLSGLFEDSDKEEKEKEDTKKESGIKKDYSDVQLALNKDKDPTASSQVGVMKKMGIPDDENGVNRSLFGKKLHQEKNEDGSLYQFDEKELAKLRGVIDAR